MAHIEDRWKRAGREAGRRWRVRYLDPGGRERNRSFDRKVDAERFKIAVEADVQRGTYIDPAAGRLTLRRYAEQWLSAQTYSESTREHTERRVRKHLYPVLGDRQLGDLSKSPSIIQAWLRGLQSGDSAGSARHLLGHLSSILDAAVEDGLISRNPCRSASVRAPARPRRKIVPWPAGQVAAVRAGLPDRYQAMVDAGAGLGLRQGEVLGLSPADVDWLRQTVHIRRQVKIVRARLAFDLPKGHRQRDVPLPDSVSLRLAAHMAAFPPVRVTLPWEAPEGRPEMAELFFSRPTGLAILRTDWNERWWHGALRQAGVTPGRENGFHALRHHFASVLLAGGIDVRTLADYLGHGDPGFTLRTYTHLLPSAPDRMRKVIDQAASDEDHGPGAALGGENAR